MTKKESVIVLLSITLCWSSSYVFIKAVPEDITVYTYLALTSGVAALLLAILCHKRFRLLTRKTLWQGLVLGLLITGNMCFEKLGLDHLPASSVSALEALNIIIVPIILMLKKKYPTRNNLAGIAIILVGILITSYAAMQGSGLLGILFIIGSCVMMSLYTISATEYTKESDPMLLTVLQLIVTALAGFVLALSTDPGSLFGIHWSRETISYVFILAFFSKAYAYTMLMYADKYVDAISVTVIAALDPVVTLFMAVIIPVADGASEIFSFRSLLGALIITIGAIVAGTDFLSPKKAGKGDTSAAAPAVIPPDEQNPPLVGKDRRYIIALLSAGIVVLFAGLGVSIDVMNMADGYTNLRPENCLSVPSGILLGPLGALSCAVGNLLADFVGNFDETRVIGFIGNFIMAYLPYKIWRTVSPKAYNTHTWGRILLYVWASALGCLACACMLGICLAHFYHQYYEEIIAEICINNYGFSIGFGLPLFIALRSAGRLSVIWLGTIDEIKSVLPAGLVRRTQRQDPGRWRRVSRTLLIADTAVLTVLFLLVIFQRAWWENAFVTVLAILSGALLLVTCLLPSCAEQPPEKEQAAG